MAFPNPCRGMMLAVALLAVGCHRSVPPAGAENAANWASHNGGYDESAYSRTAEIDTGNIARLGLASSLDLDGEQSLEATPLAVDGTLYFTGSQSAVYAVDAAQGRLLWRYDPQVAAHNAAQMRFVFGANRGAAYEDGRVFAGTLDGRLIALDAKSGKLLWSRDTIGTGTRYTITGAPRVFAGIVLIGNGGADWGARGYVTAYDARTGRQLWRFYTVPGDPAKDGADPAMQLAAKTWGPSHWQVSGGGGTVWDSMTIDPELGRVYIGVGNAGPYNPAARDPGGHDDLFLSSIVALDLRTGRYIWHYQVNPRDAWDFKATANMIATELTIDGERRKVLMQAPTNGFFYVLDRTTGRLLSAAKTGKVTWASRIDLKTGRPVEAPNIRYETGSSVIWPSPLGTHNWQPMAFNPGTGLVYIPFMQIGARWTIDRTPNAAGAPPPMPKLDLVIADRQDGKGALLAWDPIAQKVRWKMPHPTLWNGGVLTTAGGLVFQGTGDGKFQAYDAAGGRLLWEYDAHLGIVGAPIAYRVAGHDYVSVLVGYGGGTALGSALMKRGYKFGAQPRRLLTFALDGKAKLPSTAPPDFSVAALDDPALKLNPAKVAAGAMVFGPCALCHGKDLASSGLAPDLRESAIALDRQAFDQVVRGGALQAQGMPRFAELTPAQIDSLHQYIRAGARAWLNGHKTVGAGTGAHL